MIHGDNDYALSRLRARIGGRMRNPQWAQVSAARSLAGVIEQLRASGAADWIEGLGSHGGAHRIETHLRKRFIDKLDELCGWADPVWQPALKWCARLVDLPALRHARIKHTNFRPSDWRVGELAIFEQPASVQPFAADAIWLQELQRRLPRLIADDRTELALLVRNIHQHRQRFSALPAGNGWPERERLQLGLLARMRRHPLSPVHLLTAVALLWLEHERVRGEWLRLAALA